MNNEHRNYIDILHSNHYKTRSLVRFRILDNYGSPNDIAICFMSFNHDHHN